MLAFANKIKCVAKANLLLENGPGNLSKLLVLMETEERKS